LDCDFFHLKPASRLKQTTHTHTHTHTHTYIHTIFTRPTLGQSGARVCAPRTFPNASVLWRESNSPIACE
jgi:hypothetical protein